MSGGREQGAKVREHGQLRKGDVGVHARPLDEQDELVGRLDSAGEGHLADALKPLEQRHGLLRHDLREDVLGSSLREHI